MSPAVPTPQPSPRDVKPAGYYGNERRDLVDALPRPLGRVLDVGCGEGAVGRRLRAAGAAFLSGIELDAGAAARARAVYDEVFVGPAESGIGAVTGPFDTVLCLDVLEHLTDPGRLLSQIHERAAPRARLEVSVPNARHVSLVYDLMVRGTFGYTEWGHRDSTHLRWFTRRDITAVVESAGWRVRRTWHPALRRARVLHRLTRGHSTEFLVGQWYLLAERGDP